MQKDGYGRTIELGANSMNITYLFRDSQLFVENDASNIVLTIVDDVTNFLNGDIVTLNQCGTGTIQFAPGSGVTLRSKDGKLIMDGQYSTVTITKRKNGEFKIAGQLK